MTKFIHIRRSSLLGELSPMGGLTVAYDFDPEARVVAFTTAKCNDREHYNKKVGRAVTEGRLSKYGGEKLNVPEGEHVTDIVLTHILGDE